MLILKNKEWLLSFFAGAMVCAIVGGFWNLVIITLLLSLGCKLISVVKSLSKSKSDEVSNANS